MADSTAVQDKHPKELLASLKPIQALSIADKRRAALYILYTEIEEPIGIPIHDNSGIYCMSCFAQGVLDDECHQDCRRCGDSICIGCKNVDSPFYTLPSGDGICFICMLKEYSRPCRIEGCKNSLIGEDDEVEIGGIRPGIYDKIYNVMVGKTKFCCGSGKSAAATDEDISCIGIYGDKFEMCYDTSGALVHIYSVCFHCDDVIPLDSFDRTRFCIASCLQLCAKCSDDPEAIKTLCA